MFCASFTLCLVKIGLKVRIDTIYLQIVTVANITANHQPRIQAVTFWFKNFDYHIAVSVNTILFKYKVHEDTTDT